MHHERDKLSGWRNATGFKFIVAWGKRQQRSTTVTQSAVEAYERPLKELTMRIAKAYLAIAQVVSKTAGKTALPTTGTDVQPKCSITTGDNIKVCPSEP
jgi:hypothetical protein